MKEYLTGTNFQDLLNWNTQVPLSHRMIIPIYKKQKEIKLTQVRHVRRLFSTEMGWKDKNIDNY